MRIKKVNVKPSFIEIVWETRNSQGEFEEQSHKFKEKPLPAFDTCLQDLKDSLQLIMEVPSKWLETVRIHGFSVHRTASGVRSMTIAFTKGFKCESTTGYSTPQFRIDPPEEGEDKVPRAVSLEQAAQCVMAIDAIEAYINGDRLQMTLDGIENKNEGASEDEGNELGLDTE